MCFKCENACLGFKASCFKAAAAATCVWPEKSGLKGLFEG